MCSSVRQLRFGAGLVALGWLLGCRVDALLHPSAATNPPEIRLAFAPPPSGTVNQPLTPAVKVSAVDTAGRVDTTFTLDVTITLDANPGRAALAGTRTVAAVRGVATFADLSLNQADTGYSFLATAPGLRGVTSPSFSIATGSATTGDLTVTTSTTGGGQPSGYTVTVDRGQSMSIGTTDSVTYTGLAASDHAVALANVPGNCTVTAGASQTVTVPAGGKARASFAVTCTALTGSVTVTTNTTGSSLPTADYSVSVDGAGSQAIHPSGTVTFTGVSTGSHTVTLASVPANCTVSGGSSQPVNVPASGAAQATFNITCTALTGGITVSAATSGQNAPSSYAVTLDGAQSRTIAANGGSTTYTGVAVGNHTIALTNVPGNCTVTGGASKTVTVQAGQTATPGFTISCTAITGSLTVTTVTTGSSLPTADYTVSVDGGSGQPIHPNGTATFTGLSVASHTVTLAGVPANCTVSGGSSQSVNVTASGSTAAFTSACTALPPPTGSVTVTASTTDSSLPTADYSASIDGGTGQAIHPTGNVTFTGVSAGSHTVALSGVPTNCTVTGGASQTVTVIANQTATTPFAITCTALTGSLTVTTSTSGSNAPSSYTFSVDGGASQTIGASASVPISGLGAGSHSVQLSTVPSNCSVSEANPQSVTVPAGGSATARFTITCTASNQPPTAAFTPSCTGLTCAFTDQSSDPDGSVASWNWNFGDGQTATQQNPSHTYAAGGSYTVTLTVKDNQNASSSPVSHTVTVTAPPPPNQPPTAAFTSSCNGLTCSFTDQSSDPDGSVASWSWSFGDGGTATQQNPSHTYAAGGSYTVTLTVKDNQGASSSPVSHTVTVSAPNQPPVVTAGPNQNVLIGALFNLSGASFTDPDHNGPWSVTIDWGDGSSPTTFTASEGAISASHTYLTVLPASYTLTVTVTDAGGLSGSASKTVQVGTL